MNCPHCGCQNDNFQTICMSCGEPLTPGLFSCPICGKVLKVEEGISSNNLRILKDSDKKEYLVPFLKVFIKNVDLVNKRIDIVKMEGLL